MANVLYKEHYTVVPTKHTITKAEKSQKVTFEWMVNKKWNSIYVEHAISTQQMHQSSLEKFIYEHYYGYTKTDKNKTEEYRLHHPSWKIHNVIDYQISCDFEAMYGEAFSILNHTKPAAVFIAEGSSVAIEWERTKLKLDYERS
jgi:hypothetical protein